LLLEKLKKERGEIMDIKTKVLLNKFENNFYAQDLNEYLTTKMKNKELTYSQLEYLYTDMYKGKSYFITQNIYPVGEFLKKGYSIVEAEIIANELPDANQFTVFSDEKNEIGYKYNKLFHDLKFAFEQYDTFINNHNTPDNAFKKTVEVINTTSTMLREEISSKNQIYIAEPSTKELDEMESE